MKNEFKKLNEIERIIMEFADFYRENYDDITTSDMQGIAMVAARRALEIASGAK